MSPEGPSLIRLIDNLNKIVPFGLIKQTLRVGNVATMISSMMRVLLAKMSVGSITNWFGVSTGADEGMNLLQQMISTVLSWDKRELKKRKEKIDADKNGPSNEVKEAINKWINTQSATEHLQTRAMSRKLDILIQ